MQRYNKLLILFYMSQKSSTFAHVLKDNISIFYSIKLQLIEKVWIRSKKSSTKSY